MELSWPDASEIDLPYYRIIIACTLPKIVTVPDLNQLFKTFVAARYFSSNPRHYFFVRVSDLSSPLGSPLSLLFHL